MTISDLRSPTDGGLSWFNEASTDDLTAALLALTGSPAWAGALVEGRPFAGIDDVLTHSDAILASISTEELDAALAGHPRIGERGEHLATEEAARSAGEQAGMSSADPAQKAALAEANAAYEQRFGRIYLVAAAGLSAAELLGRAQQRLHNDPAAELDVVRGELARITRLRLTGLLT